MKVMVIVKASERSEAGEMPSSELLTAMGNFNEELAKAGVMLAGDGLHPSEKGIRLHYSASGGEPTVTDGPFAETKELIAGYWIWQVRDMDEARAWAMRIPAPHDGDEGIVELRQVIATEDFGEELTPELREQEALIREQLEKADPA